MDFDYGYIGEYDNYYDDSEEEEVTAEQARAQLIDDWFWTRKTDRKKLKEYKEEGLYKSFTDIKKRVNTINKKDMSLFGNKFRMLLNIMDVKKRKRVTTTFCYNIMEQLLENVFESTWETNIHLKAFMMAGLFNSANFHRLIIPEHCQLLKQVQTSVRNNFFIKNEQFYYHLFIDVPELEFFIPKCNSHTITLQTTLLNDDYKTDTLFTVYFKNYGQGNIQKKLDDEIINLSERIYELDTIEKIMPEDLKHVVRNQEIYTWNIDTKCYHCIRKKLIKRRKLLQLCLNRTIRNPELSRIVNNFSYFHFMGMITIDTIKYIRENFKFFKKAHNYKVWSCFHMITKEEHLQSMSSYKGRIGNIGCHRSVRETVLTRKKGNYSSWHYCGELLTLCKFFSNNVLEDRNWFVKNTSVPRTKKISEMRKFYAFHSYKQRILSELVSKVREENERKEDERQRLKAIEDKAKKEAAKKYEIDKQECRMTLEMANKLKAFTADLTELKRKYVSTYMLALKWIIKSMSTDYKSMIISAKRLSGRLELNNLQEAKSGSILMKYLLDTPKENIITDFNNLVLDSELIHEALVCFYILLAKLPTCNFVVDCFPLRWLINNLIEIYRLTDWIPEIKTNIDLLCTTLQKQSQLAQMQEAVYARICKCNQDMIKRISVLSIFKANMEKRKTGSR